MAGLGGIIQGFAAGGPAGAGIAMIGQAVGFLQGSVKAAEDSERVMAILKQTVENQGTAWDTVKGSIDKTLQSMQATTRFSDEELATALTTLVTHGMSVETAMGALKTAMDTATGTGKPLQTIVEGIGKAYEGQDTALTRLVPAIGDLDEKMGAGATSGDKFQATLGLLNDRFGGTAAADAATYAGVQERMGNAWDQFQETIGNAVLPALTNLMNGLMNIGTQAIGPLMDSLGELWSALFGEDVDLKGFGDLLQTIVIVPLKGLTSFIKEVVVPTVKMIHEAFQTASEVIGPPLKAIADAVGGFLKILHDSFQGFYDWLVGGSLWSDMWNQMLTAASELIGQLLSDLGTKLFEPMKSAFTGAIDTLKDLWSKGWDAMQTAATTIWSALTKDVGPWIDGVKTSIGTTMDGLKTTWDTSWGAVKTTLETKMGETQTSLNTALDGLKSALSTSTGTYGPTMTSAVSGMQGAMNAGFLLVKGDWQGALDAINGSLTSWGTAAKGIMDGIMGGLQGAVKVGLDTIKGGWDTFTGALQSGVGTLQNALDSAGGSVQQALDAVGDATTPATSTVTSAFTSAFNTISTAATNFWNWLTGHSLWPNMLDLMSGVTRDKLLDIANTFNEAFASIDENLSARFQNMFEGTKGAMGMILQIITGSLAEIRDNFMSNAIDVQRSWSDAWTEINRVAATTTQQIFNGLTTWWSILQGNFMTGLTTISGAWQTSWTSILDIVANVCGQIGAGVTTWFSQATALFTTNLTILQTNWQTSWTEIMNSAANICGQIMAGLTAWYQFMQGATVQALAALGGAFGLGLNSIYGMFSGTFGNMVSVASTSMSQIVSIVASALAQVRAMAAELQATMVTGSIWPDMLGTMESMTSTAMDNITSTVGIGFNAVVSQAQSSLNQLIAIGQQAARIASIPISAGLEYGTASMGAPATSNAFWVPPEPMNLTGAQLQNYANALAEGVFQQTYGRTSAAGPATAAEVLKATLPINVVIDGVTVSRVVEQRLVRQLEVHRSWG